VTSYSAVFKSITHNGPAIWGGCVTRREHRAVPIAIGTWYFSRETVTVQGGYGTCFCRPSTNFIEHYACRDTSLIGASSLSPVTNLVTGTGAVSRYNLSRRQKFITVQVFNCGQLCVSGCNGHYEFVLGAGAKAKTVTNNLPILSVLWLCTFVEACPQHRIKIYECLNLCIFV
jgi:hypothetical protein